MAIQSAFYNTDGTTRTFPSTKHIASSANAAVWLLRVVDNVWEIVNTSSWVLANNSIVFDVAPQVSVYSQVEIRIADEADELESSPSNIALVGASIADVNTVATNIADVNAVSTNIVAVKNTSASIANVNTVATNIINVNSVATTVVPNIAEILLADDNAAIATTKAAEASASAAAALVSETNADTSEVNALSSANTATTQAGIATTQAGIATTQAEIATTQATNSASSATAAQLSEWVAEAEAMTADSYATAPKDTFVQEYTSNGDGTFTATPTTKYSALHWAETINDANFVHKTGNETIAGVKTFSSSPIVPTPTTGTHAVNKAYVDFIIPTGVITLWYGSILSIPAGWLLCDGNNGTPDLRDRFVVGAGSSYNVGATGGSKNAVVVAHTHTGSTNSDGVHNHDSDVPMGYYANSGNGYGGLFGSSPTTKRYTNNAGAHSHALNISNSGESGIGKNLPPYYALAYIMKI